MRVTAVRTTIVSIPHTEVEASAVATDAAATEVIVEVDTDEGIIGLGEALSGASPLATEAAVRQLAPTIIGYDPFEIEPFLGRALAGRWAFYRHLANGAVAGIEMALWDIVGKALGQPVHRLFGGAVRDEMDCFFWIQRKDPADMAEEARRGVSEGFGVMYVKVGLDPRSDLEAVEAVRSGAGPAARLRVDANGAWNPPEALRRIAEMARFDLDFVEQPVPITDLEGLAYVRRACGVPICVDQGAWTKWDIATALGRQAADYVCTEPARHGGLLEFRKACAIAEVFDAPICRHVAPELGIMAAAALQVCATVPNLTIGNQTWARLLTDDVIVEDLLSLPGGKLRVPRGPGLGVTLDRDKLGRYADEFARQPVGARSE